MCVRARTHTRACHACVCMYTHKHYGAYVRSENSWQESVSSLLPSRKFWGLNSGHQTWQGALYLLNHLGSSL